MIKAELNEIRKAVRELKPLIHSITNPISINQCANAALCVGARPVMAEHPEEVAEITATAQALMINTGNITDVRMKSMQVSLDAAIISGIPCILDAVGAACSKLRREFVKKLIDTRCPTVVKGNYSEINALYNPEYNSAGVDADYTIDTAAAERAAIGLAKKYNTVILASGATDIITDGKKVIYIKNGTSQLASVTGTGCMLGALCACYLSVCHNIKAVACACAVLGICGELSETELGSGSFMVRLMDNLSVLSDENFASNIKLEEKEIESV